VLRALWKRVTNGVSMTIFKTARRLCEALECLTSATEALRSSVVVARDWHAEQGNVEARIEELERERHLFQAEIHGELLKAQAEYRKADNAEKRAKTVEARGGGFGDGGEETSDEFRDAYHQWLLETEGAPEGDNGVPPVRGVVESPASVVETLRAGKRSR